MRKTNLDNKTLDLIGKKLVKGGSPRSNDVERIISNPHLFAAVKNQIAANGTPSLKAQPGGLTLSFFRRNAAPFAGAALILVVGAVALGFFRSVNILFAVTKVQVPDAEP